MMSETTAKIDEKGRVMIPKNIRKAAKIKPGTYVNIKATETTIIIEPAESIAKKYCGLFQIAKWPKTWMNLWWRQPENGGQITLLHRRKRVCLLA